MKQFITTQSRQTTPEQVWHTKIVLKGNVVGEDLIGVPNYGNSSQSISSGTHHLLQTLEKVASLHPGLEWPNNETTITIQIGELQLVATLHTADTITDIRLRARRVFDETILDTVKDQIV